jgi:hypothetical protein
MVGGGRKLWGSIHIPLGLYSEMGGTFNRNSARGVASSVILGLLLGKGRLG